MKGRAWPGNNNKNNNNIHNRLYSVERFISENQTIWGGSGNESVKYSQWSGNKNIACVTLPVAAMNMYIYTFFSDHSTAVIIYTLSIHNHKQALADRNINPNVSDVYNVWGKTNLGARNGKDVF